jgi:hypothetical protein
MAILGSPARSLSNKGAARMVLHQWHRPAAAAACIGLASGAGAFSLAGGGAPSVAHCQSDEHPVARSLRLMAEKLACTCCVLGCGSILWAPFVAKAWYEKNRITGWLATKDGKVDDRAVDELFAWLDTHTDDPQSGDRVKSPDGKISRHGTSRTTTVDVGGGGCSFDCLSL